MRIFLQPSRPRFINTARDAVDSGKGVPSMTIAKQPLGITDVVLRDAHQSILATRVRLEDMLPIAASSIRLASGRWKVGVARPSMPVSATWEIGRAHV